MKLADYRVVVSYDDGEQAVKELLGEIEDDSDVISYYHKGEFKQGGVSWILVQKKVKGSWKQLALIDDKS